MMNFDVFVAICGPPRQLTNATALFHQPYMEAVRGEHAYADFMSEERLPDQRRTCDGNDRRFSSVFIVTCFSSPAI